LRVGTAYSLDSDLPKLQKVLLGSGALKGDGRENRQMIEEEPYNYKNTLAMRSGIEADA
jgi:hypothetical protein